LAKKQIYSSLDAAVHFGLSGGRRHQLAAGIAFVQGDAPDMYFFPGQLFGSGKPNRIGGETPR
jgi:hypothetical protein